MNEELPLPSCPEIENDVLGLILIDTSDDTLQFVDSLSQEDFTIRKNRVVFSSIKSLQQEGKSFDGVSLTTYLKDKKLTDEVPQSYISTLMTKAGIRFVNENSIETIKEKTRLRRLIESSEKIKSKSYSCESSQEIIEVFEREINSIDSESKSENLIHAGVSQVKQMIEARRKNEKIIGIPTGIKSFDNIFFGLQKSLYTAICGLPSSGKTAFVDQSVCNFMDLDIPVLYVPLESGSDRITAKIACKKCRISYTRFLHGKCNPSELNAIDKTLDLINKKPFILKRPEKLTAESLRSLVMREWRKNKIQVLVVDYLQKLKYGGESERESIARASSQIQDICINTGITSLILCQLNRESRNQKRPNMGNIKDSGQIDQDADNIVLLWNEKENHELFDGELRPSIMSIEKNKDGIQGVDEKLLFDGELMMFKERNKYEVY